jgi:hypothetical protein
MVGKGPHRDHNGELILTNPMAGNKMALIAADDIGKTALGVFRRGDEFIGKTVSIAGAPVTGEQLAAVLGEKVVHRPLSHDEVRASGQPGAVEVANTYQFYSDAPEYFTGVRDLDLYMSSTPISSPSTPGSTSTKARSARLTSFGEPRIDTSNRRTPVMAESLAAQARPTGQAAMRSGTAAVASRPFVARRYREYQPAVSQKGCCPRRR